MGAASARGRGEKRHGRAACLPPGPPVVCTLGSMMDGCGGGGGGVPAAKKGGERSEKRGSSGVFFFALSRRLPTAPSFAGDMLVRARPPFHTPTHARTHHALARASIREEEGAHPPHPSAPQPTRPPPFPSSQSAPPRPPASPLDPVAAAAAAAAGEPLAHVAYLLTHFDALDARRDGGVDLGQFVTW